MIDVKATLKSAEEKMQKSAKFLQDDLARIRAGRANLAILDNVRVESYGQRVPLNQVAALQVPDARTITIRPWERKAIKDIEKGIMDSDVGITPENNGEMVILRLPQPQDHHHQLYAQRQAHRRQLLALHHLLRRLPRPAARCHQRQGGTACGGEGGG